MKVQCVTRCFYDGNIVEIGTVKNIGSYKDIPKNHFRQMSGEEIPGVKEEKAAKAAKVAKAKAEAAEAKAKAEAEG